MKQTSLFTLPALLRPALFLAAASQHSFSVNDDLLAYPQYEVRYSEDWISETQAQSRLESNNDLPPHDPPNSDVEHYRPSDQQPTSEGDRQKEEEFLYERLRLEGQSYLCSIPQISKLDDPAQTENNTVSRAEKEKELARANDHGWELLSGMQGQCVYFISGWWSYKFCYNGDVRQFHQLTPSRGLPTFPPVEDKSEPGYVLGSYQKQVDGRGRKASKQSETKDVEVGKKGTEDMPMGELVVRGDTRYLVQKLEGGTICDLTMKPRRIDVQFHCNPSTSTDRISLIKETSTCAYLMVIQTPRLCKDVAFLPPQKDEPNTITCTPILSTAQDIADYERDMAALKQAEAEAEIWAADADAAKIFLGADALPEFEVAGDIAIGARTIVPAGVTLEKSAIVGGGKVEHIDTILSTDGRQLSKEELEKLGIGDKRSFEQLKKQMEAMAKGQEWKLEVFDTPRGKEYRGILGDGETKEGEKGEGEGEGKGEGEGGEPGEEGSEEEYYKEEL